MLGQTQTVETVVLLSQRRPDTTIDVNLNISELEVSKAETKATIEGNRVPKCPEDKRKAILDAFRHFKMI